MTAPSTSADLSLTVAVAQVPPVRPTSESARVVAELTARAVGEHGADLVVFPEGVMHEFGLPGIDLAAIAEPLDGAWVEGVHKAAAHNDCTIVAGMWEATDSSRVRNTQIAVNADGVINVYRKIHLFDSFGFRESDVVEPGEILPTSITVNELRIGLTTCYDLRFPELYRALAADGVDAYLVIAGWVAGPNKADQWTTLLTARAIENTAYVIASGLSGDRFVGHSSIIDPFGVCLTPELPQTGLGVATLNSERVREVRSSVPSLQHRRLT